MPRGFSLYDEAALQGRLWTPRLLDRSVLSGWYDSSDKPNLLRGTSSVTQILDKSGNGNHLPAASTAPTFSESALGGCAPGILSQVAAAGLRRYAGSVVNVPSPTCAVVVAQAPASANARLVSLSSTTNGADYAYYIPLITDSGAVKSYAGSSFRGVSPALTANRPFSAVAAWNANQAVVDLNGVPGAVASFNYPSGVVGAVGFGIGAGNETGTAGHVVSEALLISSFLLVNTRLRAVLTAYVAWKWARLGAWTLLADLSPANPFKNRPPLIGD